MTDTPTSRAEGEPADADVSAPERTVVDLLGALEQSVKTARAERRARARENGRILRGDS